MYCHLSLLGHSFVLLTWPSVPVVVVVVVVGVYVCMYVCVYVPTTYRSALHSPVDFLPPLQCP